ncbi:MAG: hydrogenase maturation nickel metallochaperone HypA [Chloroflexi bacterium]|nr:hydrogenase maturation nickel metallochaperone HypA [Chloroflexota bacterium]
MHEAGLCEGIVEAALHRAAGRPAVKVRVRIGGHHETDREELDLAFQVLTMGTELADATLEVVTVEGDELTLEALEFSPSAAAVSTG